MSLEERKAKVGILPISALGVGFFFHLTNKLTNPHRACFVERPGSASGHSRHSEGKLRLDLGDEFREIPFEEVCQPDLLQSAKAGLLPEIVLVCTQSDQVLPVITNFIELLEWLYSTNSLPAAVEALPSLILCSNGIYFQRVRQYLVEALEESTLFGRLPDLWSEPMGRIVGKLIRGVTIQTGQREGSGAGAIYRPGPSGRTRLAGGDLAQRQRCGEMLRNLGGWFEVEEIHSPTRAEFDKALINLFGNLLGQFKAIDAHGNFHLVKVRDIFPESDSPETRALAHHVVAVGRSVHAYAPTDQFEDLYQAAISTARTLLDHVPSTIKQIEIQLRAGTLQPQVTPTEKWLLDPLIRYAASAGLDDSRAYFLDLIAQIEQCLARAIEAQRRLKAGEVFTPAAAYL